MWPSKDSRRMPSRPRAVNSSPSVDARSMWAGATSMPDVSVGKITSPRVARPSARTSAIERSTVFRLTPSPAVRLACGSMSTHRTRYPSSASAPARLIAVVVFPTPPFWLAIAITFVTGASPQGFAETARGRGGGETVRPWYAPQNPSGHPGYPHASGVVHRICGYPGVVSDASGADMMRLSLRKDGPDEGSADVVDERRAVRPTRGDANRITRGRRRVARREAA